MSTSLPKRSELSQEKTWDLNSIYSSQDEWHKHLVKLGQAPAKLKAFAGKLSESGHTLLKALQTRDTLFLAAERLYVYASLNQSTEADNPTFQAMLGQASSAVAQIRSAAAYIEPELLKLKPTQLEALILEEAGLEAYHHDFKRLWLRKPHVRSSEVEAVMAQLSDPLQSLYMAADAATSGDVRFEPVRQQGQTLPVSHATIGGLLANPERKVRQQAWENYADGHLAHKNTLANTLQGYMKAYAVQAKIRGYASSLEMSLTDNHIPAKVYHSLLETFEAHLPLWHRYWRILKRAMKVKRLHSYDVPTYDQPGVFVKSPQISYSQATQMVCQGMEPLGPKYVDIMRRGLVQERWVDWGLNQGKVPGAYSSGVKGTHPFIFMSFDGTIGSVSTLAHELGHSMHSYYTNQHQPYVYTDYSMFVAEVASNFNQALTRGSLLRQATDPNFKLAILQEAFGNFHRYLFVMPTMARFELECYQTLEQGGALTAQSLIERMTAHFAQGYGGEVEIDPERLGASWMMFGHLYSPFYVYQYATGIAAANALAQTVLDESQRAAKRYIRFLKSGSSVFPLDALKIAGIDMEQPGPVVQGFKVLEGYVDELEKLIADS
jgi:oligoendopeptidase F